MQPLVEQAIRIANHTWGEDSQDADYQLLCEYTVGEIMHGKIEGDPAHDLECIYLVTDPVLARPIYIGSTIKGTRRLSYHVRAYSPSSFGHVLLTLGSECDAWIVSFIHSEFHRYGNFRRDETHLIIKFQPYIYGMAFGPRHNEEPPFLKRYHSHFWYPENRQKKEHDPVEGALRAVRAAFGEPSAK